MGGHDAAPAAICHLLQAADPIPMFTLSIGPGETYVLHLNCAANLEYQCKRGPENLKLAMENAVLERTKEITALCAFTNIRLTCDRVGKPSESVIVET
jgi:hypothetical protein